MESTTNGVSDFIAAYDKDPRLTGVTLEQTVEMLGPLPERGGRWVVRDDSKARTLTISSTPGSFNPLTHQIEERVDDEVLATIRGAHTGATYVVYWSRSSWCGLRTEVITWKTTTPDGRAYGPGIDLLRGRNEENVVEILHRADFVLAADGRSVDTDGRVEVTGKRPPLSREDYEAACARLGLKAVSDDDCDSYGMKYGSYGFDTEEEARRAAAQSLARRRWAAVESERAAAAAALPPAPEERKSKPRSWGAGGVRYDESCSNCHKIGVVDNDTGCCEQHSSERA